MRSQVLETGDLVSALDATAKPAKLPPRTDSFGMIGMRERVHQLRGELLVHSSVGTGTWIFVTIPTPPA